MGAEAEFVEALRPVVEANGLEIWDVERSGASVRVLVDRPEGVDLDSLAALSSVISDFLDDHDELAPSGRYELDVSSPGIERRLRSPRHFQRCLGQEVAVKTSVVVEGRRRFQGTLVAANDDQVSITGREDDGTLLNLSLPLSSIERAHTVFRWPAKEPARGNKRAPAGKVARSPRTVPDAAPEDAASRPVAAPEEAR